MDSHFGKQTPQHIVLTHFTRAPEFVDEMNVPLAETPKPVARKHSLKHWASYNLLPLSARHFYAIIICKTKHLSALCRIPTQLPEVSAHSLPTGAALFRNGQAESAEVHTGAERRRGSFRPRPPGLFFNNTRQKKTTRFQLSRLPMHLSRKIHPRGRKEAPKAPGERR